MKIRKKEWAKPFNTAIICIVPLILYLILKITKTPVGSEILWWFFNITPIYLWFKMNFETENEK